MIIAFTGYAGSGKDTAAQVLIDKYGFEKKCFADPLREAMEIINPIVADDECDGDFGYRYNEAIRDFGYVEAKKQFPEIRRFMQAFATDWIRDEVDGDFWVNKFLTMHYGDLGLNKNIVITDMRFANEERAIRDWNGYIIKIVRPGYDSDGHKSERSTDFIDYDLLINNDGTIDDLHYRVERFHNRHIDLGF